MFQKIKQFISQRKITTGFLVLVIILSSYFGYKKFGGSSAETHYALAAVQQGTIITSVSGSGQVSVSNQVDVKPKVSGDVIYVGVKNGQEVKAWTLLAQLDTRDAQKVVRDAGIALESAQLQLEKLKLNQDRDLTSLENDIGNAQDAMTSSREDGFNKVSDAFLDLPDILTGIRGILYDSTVGTTNQVNTGAYQDLMDRYNLMKLVVMINQATSDYLASAEKYDKNLDDYKIATRYSPADQINLLIDETLETARTMAQTVKDEQNLLDAVVSSLKQYQQKRQIPQAITQYQSDISGYIGKLNGFISGLLNIQNTIKNNEQKLENAQQDLDMAKKFNPFDVVSQENTVKQKEAVLADAQKSLSDCYIRAPFGGIVASVAVEKGDSISGSTVVATVITKQQIAEVTLNEIDVAKIKAGQKSTLTFDAAPDLSVAGEVSEIDTLGAVSQGVVSYTVKIAFGTQNEQIKPGMSVSADIITNVKQNALLVPNSAVKSAGETSYVEVPQDATAASQLLANAANSATGIILNPAPSQQAVEIGLVNDSVSEVTSGLKAGDLVIIRTITPSSTTTQTQSTQTRSIFGGSSGGSTRNITPLH
jgi:RND family efflux transporter MFP subunit